MVHDSHDGILVPPLGVLNRLNLATHDNDLTSRHKLATAIGRTKVLGNARGRNVAIEGLGQSGDKLVALTRSQSGGRAGCENKVAIQVDDQGISGSREEGSALSRNTQDVRARLLDELLGMAGVHHGNIQTTPLKHSDAVSHSL